MWVFFKLKSFGIKLIFTLSHILSVMILHCSRSLGKFGGFWWQHLKMLVFENWAWELALSFQHKKGIFYLLFLDGRMWNYVLQITGISSCSSPLTIWYIKRCYLFICLHAFMKAFFPHYSFFLSLNYQETAFFSGAIHILECLLSY